MKPTVIKTNIKLITFAKLQKRLDEAEKDINEERIYTTSALRQYFKNKYYNK